MRLSATLLAVAALSADEARYWGSEVYQRVGDRVYSFIEDATNIPTGLIAALGTSFKSLQGADDIPMPRGPRYQVLETGTLARPFEVHDVKGARGKAGWVVFSSRSERAAQNFADKLNAVATMSAVA